MLTYTKEFASPNGPLPLSARASCCAFCALIAGLGTSQHLAKGLHVSVMLGLLSGAGGLVACLSTIFCLPSSFQFCQSCCRAHKDHPSSVAPAAEDVVDEPEPADRPAAVLGAAALPAAVQPSLPGVEDPDDPGSPAVTETT